MKYTVICALFFGILTGCGTRDSEIRVSAASSLSDALTDVAAAFEMQFPQQKIRYNFAGSNVLRQQIEAGAPVDVFVAASDKTVDAIKRKTLFLGTPVPLFSNQLVIVVPRIRDYRPEEFADLANPAVKHIAIGGAGVPIRFYTEEALTRAKFWDSLKPKFVYGASVRQVVDYVARGEADAGFVYLTDAVVFENRLVTAWVIPDSLHSPIVYPGVVLRDAKNPDGAIRFLTFLESPPAQEIFKRYGFKVE